MSEQQNQYVFAKKVNPEIAKACARKLFTLYAKNSKLKLTENDVLPMLKDTYKGICNPYSLSQREVSGFAQILDRDGDGDITLEDLEAICLDILCGVKNPNRAMRSSQMSARITQRDNGSFVHFKSTTNDLTRSQLSQRGPMGYSQFSQRGAPVGGMMSHSQFSQRSAGAPQNQMSHSGLLNSSQQELPKRSAYLQNHTAITNNSGTFDVVRKVFRQFDVDGNGYIDSNEVKALLQETYKIMNMKKEVTDEDVYYYLKMVDANGDGKVSIEEFEGVFMKSINRLGLANSLKNSGVLKRSQHLNDNSMRRSQFGRNASSSSLYQGQQNLSRSGYLDQSPQQSIRRMTGSASSNNLGVSQQQKLVYDYSSGNNNNQNISNPVDMSNFSSFRPQNYQSGQGKITNKTAEENNNNENYSPKGDEENQTTRTPTYNFKPKSQFFSGKSNTSRQSNENQPILQNNPKPFAPFQQQQQQQPQSPTFQLPQFNFGDSLKNGFNEIVKRVFKSFDKDGNGVIDIGELKVMLESVYKSFGIPKTFNERDVQQYLDMMDNNHDGCIQLEEFQSLFSKSLEKWGNLRFIPTDQKNVLQDSTNSPAKQRKVPSASIDLSQNAGALKQSQNNFSNKRSQFYGSQSQTQLPLQNRLNPFH